MKFDMQIEVTCVRALASTYMACVCGKEEEDEEDEEQNRCHNAAFAPRLHLPRHI